MHALSLLLPLLLPLSSALVTYRSILTDCLNAASVPILLQTSSGWSEAIEPYNLRFTPSPTVVALPSTTAQIKSAVKCAHQSNVKVSIKGGGHSYGAYGLSGTLVINMVEFQSVLLDPTTKVATVGAGVRLGNMATKIFQQGQRGIPHGTCAGVGIGGHATLGGFGLDSRLWGLTIDTVTSIDAVLANGTAVTASATSNQDLFWAVRGAGPGIAVVTSFKLKTFPAPPVNINWAYTYEFTEATAAASAFMIVQEWGQTSAPKQLGYGVLLFPGGTFVLRGVYYGPKATFESLIAPLLAKVKTTYGGKEPVKSVKTLGWIESLTELAGSSLITPKYGYDLHDTFYAKSIVTKQSAPLSQLALQGLFTYLFTTTPPAGAQWMVIANLYGGPGSAITSLPPSTSPLSTSSYAHREAGFVWQFYANTPNSQPPFSPAIIGFVKNMIGALGAEAAMLPAYAPYADPELGAEAQNRYWGGGVARLKLIKNVYDPKGILYNPQGV